MKDERDEIREFQQSEKHFLFCEDHDGIVKSKNLEFEKGELTGLDFPICEKHPHAILHTYSLEQVKKRFGFKMFENREELR